MFDLKLLQQEPEQVARGLARRGETDRLTAFRKIDDVRRAVITKIETLRAERNKISAEVAQRKHAGDETSDLIEHLGDIAERIKTLDRRAKKLNAAVTSELMTIPNLPHKSVPNGKDENDNTIVSVWDKPPYFDFTPLEHWKIGEILGGLDFERAAKLAGSRFAVLWSWAAQLERALVTFMLNLHSTKHGYTEVAPPVILNQKTMTGTGQLPKFAGDLFKLEGWHYYLSPTAEVSLTNLHRDEIIAESDLPLAYVAHTLCFRSEAGSYGKDTKGLIRQHQFSKVELVRIAHPEHSYQELELLLSHAEAVLQRLKLPYRVVAICAGNLGFSSAKTYDLEVWLPGQGKYREVSSCSNCIDFQARRANLRFKAIGGKKSAYVHTLNGSGLAVGRTLVAVIENYQLQDGSLLVPEVLRPYLGGRELINRP
ncbi:serine--tRNA ligase [Desulfovibrionales bacterium]